MSLRIILGTAGSGKTACCIREILQQPIDSKRKVFLLVPEQFTSESERLLCALAKNGGLLHAEVVSFGRLAHRFAPQKRANAYVLDEIGKSMVLRKLLAEHRQELTYFSAAADKTGLIAELSGIMTEFFHYRITPEQLSALVQEENGSCAFSYVTKGKLHDLELIYRGYLDFLAQDYISQDESLGVLAKALDKFSALPETEIYIDGFYGFTPLEYTVIRQLLRLSARVHVTLTMDIETYHMTSPPETIPFFESYLTARKLRQIAAEVGTDMEAPFICETNHRAKVPSLRDLERNFFRHHPKLDTPCAGISIFACANRQAELRYVAGTITRLVKEGYRYREIAILTNALPTYEKGLRRILQEYQIPCFIDTKRSITSHPLIHLVCGWLDILAYDYRYEGMFSYLKSGLVPISRADCDRLENYVLAYGIKGKKWKLDEWDFGFTPEKDDEEREYFNRLRTQVMAPFAPVLSLKRNKAYPVDQLCDALLAHLDALGTADTLEKWVTEAEQEGDQEAVRTHQQIWKILMHLLDEFRQILGQSKVTPQEFAKILEAGFTGNHLGIIPPTVDCLTVGDLERSRLPEIKVLIVMGVNEGVLPSPGAPAGILSDRERELLAQEGTELAPGGRRKRYEERFLIYRAMTKPAEQLILTYACAASDGSSLYPSSYIDQICGTFPDLQPKVAQEATLEELNKPAAFHLLGEQLQREKSQMPPLWQEIYHFFANEQDPLWQKKFALLQAGRSDGPHDHYLSAATVKQLYGNDLYSAVSRLERFAACPFSYFVQYGLKAKERKLYQLHTPDLGILFHEVLELFANHLAADGVDWQTLTQEQTNQRISEAVAQSAPRLGNQILLDTAANRYLIRRLERISKRAAWTLVRHIQSGSFLPAGYEVGFGYHEALPPIVIELKDGKKLILGGKIDRVDLLEADGRRFVKIIDYKSGSRTFSFQDIFYGLQLQLLIYLDAYLSYFSKETLSPGGVFYFRITDPSITLDKEMSAEEIEAQIYEKMKMSGLLLQDPSVLVGIDQAFLANENGISGESCIVPVAFKKDGTLKASAYAATQEQYEALLDFVGKKAAAIGESMLEGYIAPAPYKKNTETPCTYCKFGSICRYDCNGTPLYRNLKAIKTDAFWAEIARSNETKD